MKTTSMLVRAGLCGLACALAGCMATTPVYDAHFGEAVRTVRAMQILDPTASMHTEPVKGVDGRAATAAMDRYNAQFSKPTADVSAFKVGVGTGSSLDAMGR